MPGLQVVTQVAWCLHRLPKQMKLKVPEFANTGLNFLNSPNNNSPRRRFSEIRDLLPFVFPCPHASVWSCGNNQMVI